MNITKTSLTLYNDVLQDLFKIESYLYVRTKQMSYWDRAYCFGLYTQWVTPSNNKMKHEILIAKREIDNELALFATMAHEYCHAWQAENEILIDHGESFKVWNDYFRQEYNLDIQHMVGV